MKIIEETETHLTLRQRPTVMYLLGLFLLGTTVWATWTQLWLVPGFDGRMAGVILFLAGMGLAALLLPRATTVTFDKNAALVRVKRHNALYHREKEYLLSGIKRVTVYSGREFDPSAYFVSRTYHLLLWMKKGPHVQLAGGGKLQLARLNKTAVTIQQFLKK